MRRSPVAVLTLVVLTACSDEPAVHFSVDGDTTFAAAEVNYEPGDQFAMLTEDGAVKLGLTSERIYFEVSEAVREHVDREIEKGLEDSDSRIARSIGNAVRRGVGGALSIAIDFDIDEIRDVDYRGGELVFDFVDENRDRTLRNVKIDEEPITRSFPAEDAQAFVEAFRRVKAGESLRGDDVPAKQPGTAEDEATTRDTLGGASF